jgi:hypothetical protein
MTVYVTDLLVAGEFLHDSLGSDAVSGQLAMWDVAAG